MKYCSNHSTYYSILGFLVKIKKDFWNVLLLLIFQYFILVSYKVSEVLIFAWHDQSWYSICKRNIVLKSQNEKCEKKVIEQLEWIMNWVPLGLNKFFGWAIPQDAGLQGRLMTTWPWYNEVVCLGNALVNLSVSTSGLAEHNIFLNPAHAPLLLLLIYGYTTPKWFGLFHQTLPWMTITILRKFRSLHWWGRNGRLIR